MKEAIASYIQHLWLKEQARKKLGLMSYYPPETIEEKGLDEEFPQKATFSYIFFKGYFIAQAIKYFETDAPKKFLKVLDGPVPAEYL